LFTHRSTASKIIARAACCAAGVLAFAAPSGAAAAPPADRPDGPSLRKATLDEGVLSLSAKCEGPALARVSSESRPLGTIRLACDGAGRRLRLPGSVARSADGAGGLTLTVRLRDRAGAASVPVSFARPRQGQGGAPGARAAGVTFWNEAGALCAAYNGLIYHDVYLDSAYLGYRRGTVLYVGLNINVWSQQEGHQWIFKGWKRHEAGRTGSLDGTLVPKYRGIYTRIVMHVYGGASHYVRPGLADQKWQGPDGSVWCYWA
jgi:hypothetical protein